jgi:kinesin family protein 6/9
VIVALQERSMGLRRGHVPYRNSTLTSVLRDSLGGNCRTAMIATVQPSSAQVEESIATCRFAQRVAMISNRIAVNEEVDTQAAIRRLKAEVRELREEVRQSQPQMCLVLALVLTPACLLRCGWRAARRRARRAVR